MIKQRTETTAILIIIESHEETVRNIVILCLAGLLLLVGGSLLLFGFVKIIRFCCCMNNSSHTQKRLSEAEKIKIYNKILEESIISLYSSDCSKYTQTTCAICLERFVENVQITFLICHHIFHKDCIEQWIKAKLDENPKCPICNIKLYGNRKKISKDAIPSNNDSRISQANIIESLMIPPLNNI